MYRTNYSSQRRVRGVTLIELMTVVVVVAILASIAIPSYRQYLLRSNRTEAKAVLLQLQTAQEKFYLQRNAFTDDVTGAPPTGLGLTGVTETGKYAITVVLDDGDGQSYTATATPAAGGGQEDDTQCVDFTIDERGTKGVTGPLGQRDCWR
jgi:type IV pilus assembly protein PilE